MIGDHVGGIISVLEELTVKNVIISQQGENSAQYQKFLDIIKEKNVNVIVVKKDDKIYIENKVYFDILWPQNTLIANNVLNNNSIVAKLHYNEFSVLFTGDIEKEAEYMILEKNVDLKSNILKVAHHGSKTSTTTEFFSKVQPKIALIGVGKNNNFGHPSEETLETIIARNSIICRTDLYGEIKIFVNSRGQIKLSKYINM